MYRSMRKEVARISRREFIRAAGSGAASILLGDLAFSGVPAASRRGMPESGRRPNIVLILADDMGYSDIGCFGGEMRTPALDRLATGGLRFTHFHNTARCCPSRASLLTGLYPHQAGVGDMMSDLGLDGYRGDLNRQCVTIAEVLKGAGYGTYMAGKWHVTRFLPPEGPDHNWPLQRGFDRAFAMITGAGSYFWPDTLVRDNTPVDVPEGPFYFTDAIADSSVSYIRDHRRNRADRPFFLFSAFTAPHWPLHALEEDISRARGRFDKGWDALREERYRRMIDTEIIDGLWKLTPRDGNVPAWSEAKNRAWQLRRMEVYAAQVERMDRGIGRIVAELEAHGVLDDTLILFLSDNGGCREELVPSWGDYFFKGRERVVRRLTRDGREVRFFNEPAVLPGPEDTYQSYGRSWANLSNTPFRLFKESAHAGGVATPLVAHWPARIKAKGRMRHSLGHIIDIMATCVDAAGAAYPAVRNGEKVQPMEGRSLLPAFAGAAIERDAVYCEHEGNRAVITPTWKLVAEGARGGWELYDMEADRTETNNLASKFPSQASRLVGMWDAWAKRTRVLPWPWK
jgi:arylsulfatase